MDYICIVIIPNYSWVQLKECKYKSIHRPGVTHLKNCCVRYVTKQLGKDHFLDDGVNSGKTAKKCKYSDYIVIEQRIHNNTIYVNTLTLEESFEKILNDFNIDSKHAPSKVLAQYLRESLDNYLCSIRQIEILKKLQKSLITK